MNNKLLVVFLIVCGLFIYGLADRDGEVLVLTVPFLVYLLIGFAQAPEEVRLAGMRELDKPRAHAGEIVECRIELRNEGAAVVNLSVHDRQAPSVQVVAGNPEQRLELPAGETTEVVYQFRAARGVYHWESVGVSAGDPFGLFEYKSSISCPGEMLVYPQPLKIRSATLRPGATLHAAGPIPARSAGSGIDFWGVREYRPGDSLRHLNWRLAARSAVKSRKLFTTEYEREEIADYGLILDARKFSSYSRLEEDLFEYSVSAAAALSESFLSNGNRLSLLVFGDTLQSLFPGYGKQQLNKVQSCLARARVGENFPFAYLEYLPTRLFPSRSTIVVFSPVHTQDFEVYARLISFGYDALLVAPDPIDFAARMTPDDFDALALRAAAVERAVLLKRLLQLGVKVVDWKVGQPLDAALRQMAMIEKQVRKI